MGLVLRTRPFSQIACTIGGNVAENSGGVHCLKYGLTVHNILRVVCSPSTVKHSRSAARHWTARATTCSPYHRFGRHVGVLTEMTVRLLPSPQRAQVVLAAFDDMQKAGRAVGDIICCRDDPSRTRDDGSPGDSGRGGFRPRRLPRDAAAILLCEVDGTNEEVSEQMTQVRAPVTLPARSGPHLRG